MSALDGLDRPVQGIVVEGEGLPAVVDVPAALLPGAAVQDIAAQDLDAQVVDGLVVAATAQVDVGVGRRAPEEGEEQEGK
jgi:hypothetical protein